MARFVSKPFFDAAVTGVVEAAVAGCSCELDHFEASNGSGANAFLQLFDAANAAAVTLGTTVPNQSYLIPGAAGTTGAADRIFTRPILFESGLSYAVTTTPTGNTSPASTITLNAGLLPRGRA